MLVAVDTNRGESPVTVEVKTDDEATARLVAYRWVWYGDNTAEVTDREVSDGTRLATVVVTLRADGSKAE